MTKRSTDIWSLVLPQTGMAEDLSLVAEEESGLENHFRFQLQRYAYPQALPVEDIGVVYFTPETPESPASIELRYCLVGNQYCNNPACKNKGCAIAARAEAIKAPVVDMVSISFQPGLLDNFSKKELASIFDDRTNKGFVKTISPCTKSKMALEQIIHQPYTGVLKNIFIQSKAMELLIYSSDQFISSSQSDRFGCRFLTHDEDREKVMRARDILLEHLDSPITIKELARKVAMNECYLKKGFKAMFGTTVYDYFQKERMERAKFLLYEQGLSVSEVAMKMGYSCISHFSTAFKKHTGLKPCELLR